MVYKQAKKIAIVTITLFSLLKKKIISCPALSQSESRSYLVSCIKYIKRHEFSMAPLTIQASEFYFIIEA